MKNNLIALIPALPLAGALINLLVGRKMAKGFVHFIAVASVLSAFCLSVWLIFKPLLHEYAGWKDAGAEGTLAGLHHHVWTWIEVGALKIDMAFRIDTLTAVMLLIITGIGTLIHIYSMGYMAHDPRKSTYFGYLNLFTGSMLILVLADNLPVMFIGWEGVGVCSYLLIGFWFDKEANATAGRKAFVVNRIGDAAFLLGMFLLFWATGSLTFSDYQDPANAGIFVQSFMGGERLAMWAGLFLFIGACGKSAQIPLYVWLPDAMAGPTPVSALIHAATMVTAGIYMVARLSFLYAHSTTMMAVIAMVGALTALFAAIMAFAQTDLKKVLAYSTVSQLGFMFVGVGVGAYVAGIFHLMTHAFFKAGLFLGAGSVMHAMSDSGDITKMGGLRRYLPRTHITFAIFCYAIAGLPLLAGFFSKDEILAGAFLADAQGWIPGYGKIIWGILTVASACTAFYMYRLYYLVFGGDDVRCDPTTKAAIHESPASMTWPLIILAGFTCVVGLLGLPHVGGLPNILGSWLSASFVSVDLPSLEGSVIAPHASEAKIILLMVVATAIATVAWFVARLLYKNGPSKHVAEFVESPVGAALYDQSKNKFYVDEIYEKYIIAPFRATCRFLFEVIDRFLIDILFVNGSAFLVDFFGRIARWFQNGQVQRYLVGLVIGGAVLLYCAARPQLDFDYRETAGGAIEFKPKIGSGASAHGAEIQFDWDADGEPDTEPVVHAPDQVIVADRIFGPGTYNVRMWVKEGVFGKRRSVTRTIMVTGDVDSEAAEGGEAGGEE